ILRRPRDDHTVTITRPGGTQPGGVAGHLKPPAGNGPGESNLRRHSAPGGALLLPLRLPVLLFLCTFRDGPLPPNGLASAGEPFRLHRALDAARAACRAPGGAWGRVLVLDPDRLALATADPPAAHRIPPEAVLNL